MVQLVAAAIAFNSTQKTPMGGAAAFADVECILPRERETRWDVRLTAAWVEAAAVRNAAFRVAQRLAEEVMRQSRRCAGARVDWHVQMVKPGSPRQGLHVDDDDPSRCYYTLILPLVDDVRAGGTYFPGLDRTFAEYGAAVVFDGSVEHAGLANLSERTRYFLYAAMYTGTDENCD